MIDSPIFKGLVRKKESAYDFTLYPASVEIDRMMTCEGSRSFFCSELDGKFVITNESVKSFIIDKLKDIITTKIAKMDVEYQDIIKTNGNYKQYKHFDSINDTITELMKLVGNTPSLPNDVVSSITAIRDAHVNVLKNVSHFKEAYTYNIPVVKQYYLTVVASIIYSIGFIITSMLDYERREGNVDYVLIFKNQNLLERGLPKNMLTVIHQFNYDIRDGKVFVHIKEEKNRKPKAVTNETVVPLLIAGIGIGLAMLPSIIRHVIYFFMYSKIKLADHIRAQADFLALNARNYAKSGGKEEYVKKQEKYVSQLREFAAKLSTDRYLTEKQVSREIDIEDKRVVKEADDETRAFNNGPSNTDASDIFL
jgi:hypothetical protein